MGSAPSTPTLPTRRTKQQERHLLQQQETDSSTQSLTSTSTTNTTPSSRKSSKQQQQQMSLSLSSSASFGTLVLPLYKERDFDNFNVLNADTYRKGQAASPTKRGKGTTILKEPSSSGSPRSSSDKKKEVRIHVKDEGPIPSKE